MKIQVFYIGDRENMITSQIVSGYRSYIHKDMYLGHLESLFTVTKSDCTLSDHEEQIVLV